MRRSTAVTRSTGTRKRDDSVCTEFLCGSLQCRLSIAILTLCESGAGGLNEGFSGNGVSPIQNGPRPGGGFSNAALPAPRIHCLYGGRAPRPALPPRPGCCAITGEGSDGAASPSASAVESAACDTDEVDSDSCVSSARVTADVETQRRRKKVWLLPELSRPGCRHVCVTRIGDAMKDDDPADDDGPGAADRI